MKKTLLLMLLTAFTAVASFAQPAKRSHELRVLTAEQMKKELAAKPMPAKKAHAPLKANVTVDDLVGVYTANVYIDNAPYTYKVTLKASEVEGEVLLSGIWWFNDIKATVDSENSRLAIELGQQVYYDSSYGRCILAVAGGSSTGTIYATVEEDGTITFPSDLYLCMVIAEGSSAGNIVQSKIYPGMTLTPGFPDFALTPWDDKTLTFLGEGDVVGDFSTLVTGVASNGDDWVGLEITTTDLVNVEDPDDQLPLSVNNNLSYLTPILVGEDEILCNNGLYADNKPFSTLVGEHEFILIDGYGSDEDFEAVKDVLAGKIAGCYRGGSVSYYIKANAAVANGAIGLIVVNNQEGTTNMNLSGYKYDKPVASITKADGVLLKESATYVDGEVSYYQGSLTVTDEEKPYHSSFVYTYGNEEEDNEGEVKAVVQDWTNATPGATYQATINYAVTYRKYNEELDTWEEKEAEMAPTTLTLRVLNSPDLVITPWDEVELTYGSTEGDLIGSPNTLVSGLNPDSRDYVTVKVTSTELANYWYESEPSLSLDFGGNMDITYYYGYGYEPYSEEFDVRAVISDTKYAHAENPYVAYLTYEVTYYAYDAITDSYTEIPLTTDKTMLWVMTPPLDIVFTPWADSELTYGNTEGDVVGTKSALLSGLPDSKYNYAAVSVTNTHLINVADPDDQLILALKAPTWESDNLMDYNPLLVAGKELEYSETSGYGNKPISTIVGEHKFIYIDNYGDVEDFEKVKDVLEGKIAVCNRGGISFYVKANAAAANGAIALIVVNNQEGTINMNLSGIENDNPAVSIKQVDGEWLKENATYVDGDAPYYQGTLTIGETEIGHSIYGMGIGYNESTGADYSDYELSAYVYDWTNATPGATYQATITYSSGTYYDWYESYSQYVGLDMEIGTPSTTVTVTIPEENSIEDITAGRNADGRMYNLLGIPVGKDYKGVVIQNGRKVLQ
jgi:hypothetical protein